MPLESLLRTLGEHLQADDHEHGYLLLDPMLRETLEEPDLLAHGCEVFPIPIDRPQLSQSQWPRLVKLRPAAVEILLASISLAMSEQSSAELESEEGFVVGGWLRSAAEPRVLVHHLQDLMRPSEPRVGRRYLRLADRRVLRGWQSFAGALPTDYLPQAERALSSVRSLGVTQPADIVLMSAYQLQIHPQLCEHPRVVELVRAAQSSDVPLRDALAEIPDPEGWDRIRHELTTGSRPYPLA